MKVLSVFAIVFGLLISGCVTSNSPSVNSVDLANVDFSYIETMKKGKSCSKNIFFIPIGSDQLLDATKDARIRHVKYVEKSFSGFPLLFLPIFSKSCVIAYGE